MVDFWRSFWVKKNTLQGSVSIFFHEWTGQIEMNSGGFWRMTFLTPLKFKSEFTPESHDAWKTTSFPFGIINHFFRGELLNFGEGTFNSLKRTPRSVSETQCSEPVSIDTSVTNRRMFERKTKVSCRCHLRLVWCPKHVVFFADPKLSIVFADLLYTLGPAKTP